MNKNVNAYFTVNFPKLKLGVQNRVNKNRSRIKLVAKLLTRREVVVVVVRSWVNSWIIQNIYTHISDSILLISNLTSSIDIYLYVYLYMYI